tara:strand:- start:127 stop:2004 length:1878 start_codon:yes stop_codon:yes gene_type:complete
MKNKSIAIIQDMNFSFLFFNLKYFFYSDEIYFIEKFYPKNNLKLKLFFNLSKKIIFILFKNKIKKLNLQKLLHINFNSNQEVIKLIDKEDEINKLNPLNDYMLSLIESKNCIKYLRAVYCNFYSEFIYSNNVVKYLIENNSNQNSKYKFFHQIKPKYNINILNKYFSISNVEFIEVKNYFYYFSLIIFCFLNIIYLFLIRIFKFRYKIKKSKVTLIQPMLFGFNYIQNKDRTDKANPFIVSKLSLIKSDSYLYSKYLKQGDILHLYDKKWLFSRDETIANNKYMRENKLKFKDVNSFKINPNLFKLSIKTQFHYLKFILKNLLKLNYFDLLIINKINTIFYNRKILFENVKFKKEFFRDDYNPRSTLESIINSTQQIESTAVQHHIHPVDYPSVAFIHFDKYLVFSELFYNYSKKYWKNMKIIKVGRENLDNLHQYANQKNTYIGSIKPNKKKNILVLLPSFREWFDHSVFNNFFTALLKFTKYENNEINIYIKVRNATDELSKKLLKISLNDQRIITNSKLSTHELMVNSELIITHSTSFSIWESAALKKKFFILNIQPFLIKHYFPNFKTNAFISSEVEIFDLFCLNFKNYYNKKDWEDFYQKTNYYFDGLNEERYKKAIYEN